MTTSEKPPGLSVWEAELYDHMRAHIDDEAELLAGYRELAQDTDAEHVRYLVRLIMEDEKRHHAWFTDLLNTIRATVEPVAEDEQVPLLRPLRDARVLVDWVTQLAEYEQEDAHRLDRLQKELRSVRDTTVWSLLVELMQLDTEKHLRILHFIKDHASA